MKDFWLIDLQNTLNKGCVWYKQQLHGNNIKILAVVKAYFLYRRKFHMK